MFHCIGYGYKIARWNKRVISLPFAFNPFVHHAYPARTLWDFAFVGTNSPFKVQETNDYLVPIVCAHEGILAGTGWSGRFGNFTQEEAGLLYNFAAICPNYHIRAQIETNNEVNERTHAIAASGGFQLVDTPAALREMYSENEIASAISPAEYHKLFRYYLGEPAMRHEMAIRSMRVAWKSHSSFIIGQTDRFPAEQVIVKLSSIYKLIPQFCSPGWATLSARKCSRL
jgi:hypothetical protein